LSFFGRCERANIWQQCPSHWHTFFNRNAVASILNVQEIQWCDCCFCYYGNNTCIDWSQHFHSWSASCPRCLGIRTHNYTRLFTVVTLAPKAGVRLTEIKSHGNNVCDVFIAQVISGNAQSHKQTNKQM